MAHRRRAAPASLLTRAGVFLIILALLYAGARWTAVTLYPIYYRDVVFRQAGSNALSPYLVAAVIRVESRWRPNVTSRTGARGLMQIMPDTGRWVAQETGLGPLTEQGLYHPPVNIAIGTWYLAHLRDKFDGQLLPALAAYNGGEHNVRRWLAEGRWSGTAATVNQIPFPETRDYVQRVMSDYHRYRRIYGAADEEGALAATRP